MKKCRKCGTVQDDSRSTCIDCGAVLPKPMTDEEEKAHEEALDDRLDGMAERTEDFYVPKWARILGFVCLACIVGTILFLAFTPNRRYIEGEWVVLTFGCAIGGVVLLLLPRFCWLLGSLSRRWWYADGGNLKPSFAYIAVVRAVGVFFTVFAVICLCGMVTSSAHRPQDTRHYTWELENGETLVMQQDVYY